MTSQNSLKDNGKEKNKDIFSDAATEESGAEFQFQDSGDDSVTVDSGLIDLRSLVDATPPEGIAHLVDESSTADGLISSPDLTSTVSALPIGRTNPWFKYGFMISAPLLVACIAMVVYVLAVNQDNAEASEDKVALLEKQLEELKTKVTSRLSKPAVIETGKQIAKSAGQLGELALVVPQTGAGAADETLRASETVSDRKNDKSESARKQAQEKSEAQSKRDRDEVKSRRAEKESEQVEASPPVATADKTEDEQPSKESRSVDETLQGIFRATEPAVSQGEAEAGQEQAEPAPSAEKDDIFDLLGPAVSIPEKKERASLQPPTEVPPGQPAKVEKPTPTPAAAVTVPDQPLSRGQVHKGMIAVSDQVRQCGHGRQGLISMRVTIGQNGAVVDASTIGAHAGTPLGKCAAHAVKSAKFPAFTGPSFTVKYPFRL